MIPLHGEIEPGMKFADLHLHTNLSDGKLEPEQLVEMAERAGFLSAIAITDHGTLDGAKRARLFARQQRLKISVFEGQEIKSTGGDMIALYFNPPADSYRSGFHMPIKDGLSPQETAKRIKKQDGQVYIPHPFLKMFGLSGFGDKGVHKLLSMGIVDAWEVFNAGMAHWKNKMLDRNNEKALQFWIENQDKLGAPIAASDGHGYMSGWGFVGYHGDLKKAILQKRTVPIRLDEQEEERLTRLAILYHNEDEINAVNRIRAKHKLPLFGGDQQVEVVLAKARKPISYDNVSTFLSPSELVRFEKKKDSEKGNWAASRLAAKLGYQKYHPERSLTELVIENQKIEGHVSSGPPWIKEYPDLFASLAHWGDLGAAVVAPHLAGIDIGGLSDIPRHKDDLYLHRLLRSRLLSKDEEIPDYMMPWSFQDIVTAIWSVKEACYKGPRSYGIRRQTAPLNLVGISDSENSFRVEIRDRFPHDYWWANVLKISDGLHLAVSFPQNQVPNDYSRKFEGNFDPKNVLSQVSNLPGEITQAFEVLALHP